MVQAKRRKVLIQPSLSTDYPNVKFSVIAYPEFVSFSKPLSHFLYALNDQTYEFWYTTLSDVLRYYLLYKYGGTYLDSDQIVMRKLPDAPNLIGAESKHKLGTTKEDIKGGQNVILCFQAVLFSS